MKAEFAKAKADRKGFMTRNPSRLETCPGEVKTDLPLEAEILNAKEDRMSTQSLTEDLKKRSAWSIFMGVITAVLGVFLIAYPLATATITTLLLGWVLIFVGIAQFVFALYSQTPGNFLLRVLFGVIYGIMGVVLAFFPLGGVVALTGLLGTLLLVQAGLGTAMAFQVRPLPGWGWFLADAAASLSWAC